MNMPSWSKIGIRPRALVKGSGHGRELQSGSGSCSRLRRGRAMPGMIRVHPRRGISFRAFGKMKREPRESAARSKDERPGPQRQPARPCFALRTRGLGVTALHSFRTLLPRGSFRTAFHSVSLATFISAFGRLIVSREKEKKQSPAEQPAGRFHRGRSSDCL